jgi:AcrR family transcriptional regulator
MQEKKEKITRFRKRQILDAAREVFSRKGYDQATTAEIAQTAGIAEGTIYNYFQSKRDLLVTIISDTMLTDSFFHLLDRHKKDGNLFPDIIEDRINAAFLNSDINFLMLTEMQRNPDLIKRFVETVLSPGLDLAKQNIQSGIEAGIFRPVNTETVVRIIVGMIIGLAILYRMEGEKGFLNKISRHDLANTIVDILAEGLTTDRV